MLPARVCIEKLTQRTGILRRIFNPGTIAMDNAALTVSQNGALPPDAPSDDARVPRPLRETATRRPKDSEADAFVCFLRDFTQLPWNRRRAPGIRRL
jgi:hypothetical protein